MKADFPILEFDEAREAVIEPARAVKHRDVPEHCVLCFFQDVISRVVQRHQTQTLRPLKSEMGKHPVYVITVEEQELAIFHVGVGAPLAAAMLEELIARGGRKFIACGGSGVLEKEIAKGHILIPGTAVRDEGTSYHYVAPGREVNASPEAVRAIEQVLQEHNCQYLVTKTWTTDAFYRETPAKVKLRKSEGCLAVEMEAAAFFAVAQFRDVLFGQILYAGDDVSGLEWDHRNAFKRNQPVREQIFWLAVEACLSL